MSEPKSISPLLDGFLMGSPMSGHDGISCCPAIKENTDQKYIVKIISIPATQAQMDALLLAGAYKDPADVMEYFRKTGEAILEEAKTLTTLSKLEGFLPYEGWQMEPITRRRLGYEVYLLGSYKRSLDKYVKRNQVTHLEAINLGLDLCSALSVCRQAGYLYVDLKPTNIFISEKKEYRIGDVGFIPIGELSFATIPDRYRSAYTPPELSDPMVPLSLTIDTFAVGMILYQLYNEGQLPVIPPADSEEAIAAPINADYELAEIILKAIHPDPEKRWTDPKDMGQALVSYMQRNAVNDVPITPYLPLEFEEAQEKEKLSEDVPADSESADSPPEQPESEGSPPPEEVSEAAEEVSEEESPPEKTDSSPDAGEDAQEHPDSEDLEETDPLLPHEMSDELSRILEKADDLIAHETPEGVVLPEIPDPPDPFAFAKEDSDEIDDSGIPRDPLMEDESDTQPRKVTRKFAEQSGKRLAKKLLTTAIVLLILAGLGFAGYWYYQNIYLQTIRSIDIDGTKHDLTVNIDSDVDDALLQVTCSDSQGNTMTQGVINGQATFTGLTPDTLYSIELSIEGFHELVGQTSDIFTTDTTTTILSFTPAAGEEDGSVVLTFTVEGEEPETWTLSYMAEGEEEQVHTFSGHSVSITGMSIGKMYTFTLDAGDSLSLSGETVLEYMPSRLILAKDLTITSTGNNDMTVHWNVPGDVVVDSWTVRCYNESGYDNQLTTTETQISFTDIDPTLSYTVEVTASGMTQPAKTSITANPINITQFTMANEEDPELEVLKLSWEYTGSEPEGGWLLTYSIDGGSISDTVKCSDASAEIGPIVPSAKYVFTVQAADGTSVFSNVYSYTTAEAEPFSENALTADKIEVQLLKTPEKTNWRYEDLDSDVYTDQFAPGDSISLVLHGTTDFYLPGSALDVLYVVEDAYGNILPDLVTLEKRYWKDLWYAGDYHYSELTVPKIPENSGDYVLHLYFNGMSVAEVPFTITD